MFGFEAMAGTALFQGDQLEAEKMYSEEESSMDSLAKFYSVNMSQVFSSQPLESFVSAWPLLLAFA